LIGGNYQFTDTAIYQDIISRRSIENPTLSKKEIKARFKSLLYRYEGFDDELSSEELIFSKEALDQGVDLGKTISTEDALKEIDILFRIIKYGYAGYQYFGGDETFHSAKEKIVFDINQTSNQGQLLIGLYIEMIAKHLDFIQDGHFQIDKISFRKVSRYYSTNQYLFNKDKDGVYTHRKDQKHYLVSINGTDPSKYINYSMDEKGEIFYQLGMLSEEIDGEISINLEYDDGFTQRVLLKPQKSTPIPGSTYLRKAIDNIPVIENRSLSPSPARVRLIERFVSDVKKLQDKKLLILDIRSHQGGNENYAVKWCSNLTGEKIKHASGFIFTLLTTKTARKLHKNFIEAYFDKKEAKSLMFYQNLMGKIGIRGWFPTIYRKGARIHNNTFIIVLIDQYAASAGEGFVSYLRRMDNVIFIGSNTAGAFFTGDVGVCQLPYSNVTVRIPTSIRFEPDFVNRDGIGYLPDIWVEPEHALEYAIEFARKNF
jgi:hypothetical protein